MPRCKECKQKFEAKEFLQKFCKGNVDCLTAEGMYKLDKMRKTKLKEANVKHKKDKEALMTHSNWLQLLQKVFNTYIRMRDKGKPCISCGTTRDIKYDAGHLWPTTYQYLRFNEDNVHRQCSANCNMYKSGNTLEYVPRLIERIGKERVQKLEDDRHKRLELSIPEIKEKIDYYKEKIKKLK